MAERVHRGSSASPGLAIGPLVRLGGLAVQEPASKPGTDERQRLHAAIDRARGELEALAAAENGIGAEVLAFQSAMLEDPELIGPAFVAIGRGSTATAAWKSALMAQVEHYEEADDEYFRARAADLADLRDRVLAALGARAEQVATPPGAIVLDRDLTPSRFLGLDWRSLGGAALEAGSPSSHVAMLARARGVPMVTGLGEVAPTGEAVLDAAAGLLILAPEPATLEGYARQARARDAEGVAAAALLHKPAVTAAGEPVELMVNVDDPNAVSDVLLAASDGIGLLRTEFLFLGRDRLPDEEEQHRIYAGLLDRLGGKPCIVRTLDIGGDKPLPGVRLPEESNPFLGLRGLRLCLDRPELFRPQVRALLRAAVDRELKVMLPMVTTAAELAEARSLVTGCLAELRAEGVPAALPPLGIMVETPAAALAIDLLDADFYSIGSNDLTQYVMAAARDAGGRVAALLDPRHPAMLRLIGEVVRHGAATGRPVSLCGDLGSNPEALGRLLALGLRRLSVAPAALARIKLALARHG